MTSPRRLTSPRRGNIPDVRPIPSFSFSTGDTNFKVATKIQTKEKESVLLDMDLEDIEKFTDKDGNLDGSLMHQFNPNKPNRGMTLREAMHITNNKKNKNNNNKQSDNLKGDLKNELVSVNKLAKTVASNENNSLPQKNPPYKKKNTFTLGDPTRKKPKSSNNNSNNNKRFERNTEDKKHYYRTPSPGYNNYNSNPQYKNSRSPSPNNEYYNNVTHRNTATEYNNNNYISKRSNNNKHMYNNNNKLRSKLSQKRISRDDSDLKISDQVIGLPDVSGELNENQFYKKYWVKKKLGSGSFSKVRKIIRQHDGKPFALKIIKKAGKSKEDLDALQKEIDILQKCNHKNVVKLTDWMYTSSRIYMVVEFCQGGDVFEKVIEQKTFSEMDAAHVIRQVVAGLEHIHELRIVHRDLKPDNLMYLTKEPNSEIKIIDFGLAGDCSETGTVKTPCGTAHYVAPEVLSGKPYNYQADMWSLGVIVYMLLCGFPPFFDTSGNQKRLYKLIRGGKYRFPSPYWDYISESAKDLIRKLLVKDPKVRLTATQALKHSWIKGKSAKKDNMSELYMKQMKHFQSSKHFTNMKLDISEDIDDKNDKRDKNNNKSHKEVQIFAEKKYSFKY